MDLIETLRSTAAVRDFTDEPVPDEVITRILDNALRFAPSGGNRQGWRVVVMQDPETRRKLRDIYLAGWYEYLAMSRGGSTPWGRRSPIARLKRGRSSPPMRSRRPRLSGWTRWLRRAPRDVPVLLVVLADLRALAAVDRDGDRYTFVGGASVYPFAWNVLSACALPRVWAAWSPRWQSGTNPRP